LLFFFAFSLFLLFFRFVCFSLFFSVLAFLKFEQILNLSIFVTRFYFTCVFNSIFVSDS
jgi:hypothetical protein